MKQENKVTNYKITNTMNKQIMNILKNHLSEMNIDFNDNKFSDNIYNSIHNSYKDSKKIKYDYSLNTFITSNLNPSTFLDSLII